MNDQEIAVRALTEPDIAAIVARVLAELEPPEPTQTAVNLGHFQVAPGQTITADHMNSALQRGVPKFASAAARDAQWPTPPIGAMCYLTDVNILEIYDSQIYGGGVGWHAAGGLRMGYATMGLSQSIPGGSVATLVKLGTAGGAANKAGRATWAANGEVTLPYTGTYLLSGSVTWSANSTGERRCYVRRYSNSTWTFSGVAGGANEVNTGAVGSTLLRQSVTAQAYINAGEKVGLWVQHSATAALTLAAGGEDSAKFTCHLLGAE